jgi:hypothetical protein
MGRRPKRSASCHEGEPDNARARADHTHNVHADADGCPVAECRAAAMGAW